jgi:hypothetical protein
LKGFEELSQRETTLFFMQLYHIFRLSLHVQSLQDDPTSSEFKSLVASKSIFVGEAKVDLATLATVLQSGKFSDKAHSKRDKGELKEEVKALPLQSDSLHVVSDFSLGVLDRLKEAEEDV